MVNFNNTAGAEKNAGLTQNWVFGTNRDPCDKDAKPLIKSQIIVVLTCDQNLTVQCIAVERRGGHLGYEM